MKFIKSFFNCIINVFSKMPIYSKRLANYVVSIFSIVPLYLRGLVILILIMAISFVYKKLNTPEYFVDNNPDYIVLENSISKTSQNYIKKNNQKNLNEKIKIDKKNNLVKGIVRENLKAKASKFDFFNKSKKKNNDNNSIQQQKDEISNSIYLKSFINDYVFGKADAPVSIVEYSSFKCPHCLNFHKENMEKIKTNYIDTGKVKYIKRIIIQKNTLSGVMLPYCAREDFKYSIINDLYSNANIWTNSSSQSNELKKIALKNGFSPISYTSCIRDENLAKKLLNKQNAELKDLKIFSTPTIFINGKKQKGNMSYEDFSKKIDEAILESKNNN